jgi:hypothetical protein
MRHFVELSARALTLVLESVRSIVSVAKPALGDIHRGACVRHSRARDFLFLLTCNERSACILESCRMT